MLMGVCHGKVIYIILNVMLHIIQYTMHMICIIPFYGGTLTIIDKFSFVTHLRNLTVLGSGAVFLFTYKLHRTSRMHIRYCQQRHSVDKYNLCNWPTYWRHRISGVARQSLLPNRRTDRYVGGRVRFGRESKPVDRHDGMGNAPANGQQGRVATVGYDENSLRGHYSGAQNNEQHT